MLNKYMYHRTIMGQNRLRGIAILSIEAEKASLLKYTFFLYKKLNFHAEHIQTFLNS